MRLPAPLTAFWKRAEPILRADDRLVGVLAAGSAISGEMDDYSDLDLILAVKPESYDEVMATRVDYPARIPGLLASFIGYHVGEPRLVITLFADPLVHVDFKFVTPDTLGERIETPVVLFERAGELSARIGEGSAAWPNRDPQWFEDRFWVWAHYGAAKIARGELFEALGFLGDIRGIVLGPLVARRHGRNQREVRRIEELDPAFTARLKTTIATHNRAEAWSALDAAIELYLDLRADEPPPRVMSEAESAVRVWIAAERGS